MYQLAQNYANQQKYSEAEKAFRDLLEVQRRVTGPEVINTLATFANIGWVQLQEKRHADAERTLREVRGILVRTAATSWERFNVESMLGASLAAQRKFEESEPLLISGYEGLGSTTRTSNTGNTNGFTQDQAGAAIVQLYADWGTRQTSRME